jgi:hypothetical protein
MRSRGIVTKVVQIVDYRAQRPAVEFRQTGSSWFFARWDGAPGGMKLRAALDPAPGRIRARAQHAITLDFIVDSGAADVSIPADVVMTLMRTKTLKETDFLGEQTYVLAEGSKVPSQTFVIRSLKVGNKVLENVNGSVASVHRSLLLGQTFLSRFRSWSVDNTKHALLLSE